MFNAQHHERYDMLQMITNYPITTLPPSRVRATAFTRRLGAIIIMGPFCSQVFASPFERMDARSQILPRSMSSSGNLPIWVPIIFVAIAVIIAFILMWNRRSSQSNILGWATAAALGSGVTIHNAGTGTMEVTADQLAGRTQNGTTAPAVSSRRARRNRRTPSQISTKSLPAYNKEPGDEELVIFRGPMDLEDGSVMPTTIVMPSLNDDGNSLHSRNTSQGSSIYPPEPHPGNDVPLLNSTTPRTGEDPSIRRSLDTSHSSENADNPRGEAPPYFEVVDQPRDEDHPVTTAAEAPESPSTVPLPEGRASRSRSGFRSILNAFDRSRHTVFGNSQAGSNNTSTHTRNNSSPLAAPAQTHSLSPSGHHRPSNSGSGSMLSLSPFRTISRQRSIHTMNSNHMSSPSAISLNSISAPLTHTVIRTEFTYPKAGPTPEQLKLISSRETFARFGMPYGADAIAFAASASRPDLDPPPEFQPSGSEIHVPGAARGTTASESVLSLTVPETSSAGEPAGPQNGNASNDATQNQAPPAESSSSGAAPTPTNNTVPKLKPILLSSYGPTSTPPRSVSRASSVLSNGSYATAAESMADPSNTELDLGSPTTLHHSGASTPTTPVAPRVSLRYSTATFRTPQPLPEVVTGRTVWL